MRSEIKTKEHEIMQPTILKKDFDYIVKYIDDHIQKQEESADIIKGLIKTAGWCLGDFKQLLHKKKKMRLDGYITKRKIYFTFLELSQKQNLAIGATAERLTEVSKEYFNRQFKAEFGLTPTEARANPDKVIDNRLPYEELCDMEDKTVVINSDNTVIYEPNSWMLDIIEYAKSEYGFDCGMCRDLIEMADRLGIPARVFIDSCFDAMIDAHEYGDNLSPKVEVGIDLGLSSEKELDEMCEYYGCTFMELDSGMVNAYRNRDDE